MAGTLQQVAWEECLIEPRSDRAVESYARSKQGFPQPMIGYFAPVPWMARALVDLHCEHGLLLYLDQAVADLVVLAVSQENSCRYCYAGVRALLWLQGMSWARIERMEQDLARADLSPRTMAAVRFARSQSRDGPAGMPAAREALRRAGYGAEEMKEIAYVAAATDFSNRAHTIPAIPARSLESMPDQFLARLLRPWLGRLVRSHRHRGHAVQLEGDPPCPYADVVASYAGSPIAPMLATMLGQMWASSHLTRRCKLLMFAVIARGLGSVVCSADVRDALHAEGVGETTLTQVLTHLGAPELDRVERVVVPFARETIWYEPAAIQRRARLVRDHLDGAQFIEAIGVAALANAVCRLRAMVVDDA